MLPVPAPSGGLPRRALGPRERLAVVRPAGEPARETVDVARPREGGPLAQVPGERPLSRGIREGDGETGQHVGEGLVGEAELAVADVPLLEGEADVVARAQLDHR